MAKDQRARIYVGTSGWSYRSWRGVFYPEKLPARLHLDFHARNFCSAELNGVFYRTPAVETVRAWVDQTPEEFVFGWISDGTLHL